MTAPRLVRAATTTRFSNAVIRPKSRVKNWNAADAELVDFRATQGGDVLP